MTRYRIINRWDIFWIERKLLWFWVYLEPGRYNTYKTLIDAQMRLENIKRTQADKGCVVWESEINNGNMS